MKFFIRNSAGSMPITRAASSASRSIVWTASVTRNEQRYATPPGALFVYAPSTSTKPGASSRAGDDVEQAGRELGRVGGRVAVAVVREGLDPQPGHPAVVVDTQLRMDVIVPREGIRLEVLGPVLDPLDRPSQRQRRDDRDHVSRVHRHLAAEAPADVVRLDADRRLRDARDQADHRAVDVGRLAGDVEVEVSADWVPVRDTATGLDRGHVDARDVDVDRDDLVGGRQGRIGGRAVTGFPMPDVVVLLVRPAIGTQDRGVREHRLERVEQDRQRLVVDVNGGDRVGGLVAGLGDDRRDLLGLVHDRVDGQDHLLVAGERRHPVEAGLLEILAGDHRQDAGHRQRLARVDRLDLRVRVRAADDVHPDHVRQDDVLDVHALAADEPGVLLALLRVAHAPDFGGRLERGFGCHLVAPPQLAAAGEAVAVGAASAARSSPAACWIALTMFT
jgi:hypothetical protein